MRIKLEPIDAVKPHPSNPRRDHDVQAIANSIRAFGFRQPLVVYDGDGHLMVGHGRLLAAKELNLDKVPVHHVSADELTSQQAAAYRLADNRSAEGSEWDEALLLAELEALGERERQEAGFEAAFLDELRRRQELEALSVDPAEDEVPALPAKPVTRPGDLWLLGEHRLLCGDANSAECVTRLLGGSTPDMAWCDPPYGINAVKGERLGGFGERGLGSISGTKPFGKVGGGNAPYGGWKKERVHGPSRRAIIPPGMYYPIIGDDSVDTAIAAVSACVDLGVPVVIFWGANNYAHALPPSRRWIVWDKETTGNFSDVELAWTNMDAPTRLFRHQWSGLMKASERGERRVHPTQKPVALASWCFAEFGKRGDIVLDLFLGSAPSLIAAEKSGRVLRGMELAPGYVDVSVLRWQAFSGKAAVLDGGGTFEKVAAARAGAAAA